MDFEFFKLQRQVKRSGECRRRDCAEMPDFFKLHKTRCIGACGLAPVLTVNDDVYGRLTPDDVDGILEKYM